MRVTIEIDEKSGNASTNSDATAGGTSSARTSRPLGNIGRYTSAGHLRACRGDRLDQRRSGSQHLGIEVIPLRTHTNHAAVRCRRRRMRPLPRVARLQTIIANTHSDIHKGE
jgi:hypothetical protein